MSESDETPAFVPEEGGESRMLRDMDRWKDRVEVSLDNRQVFFLFFGTAIAACLIFVLGVMVGKRLEARAREQVVVQKSDPLAVLDQAEGEGDVTPTPVPSPSSARTTTPTPTPTSPSTSTSPPPPPKPAAPPPSAEKPKAAPPPPPAAIPPVAEKPKPAPPPPIVAPATPPAVAAEKLASASKAPPPQPAAEEKKPAHYTLQVSAFQDRAEADDFAKKFASSGYKVSIVAADIPGKGVWYRVRLGEFSSEKAALDAKADFEKKQHVIAYVTKL